MSRPTRSLRVRVARALVLVCVGALTLTGCDFSVYSLPLPGGADLGDHPYSVTVQFRDVLDLVPQSAVKVDDVTVGRVDKISLDGYTAEVKVLLKDSVKLPDNAVADIRQTSLLGEKFVSLSPPPGGASPNRLSDGDIITLDRSGRNPEVEEVLGALSLLLNGGGVAQLKTISDELSKAMDGRESDVRSVLDQLDTFMKQLDTHKDEIVQAIESLNRLAISLNKQKGSIELALDELPRAVASINRQRDDLVRMLKALSRISSVGTRVIGQSKQATIDSLRALAPTLTKLSEAGDALPKSLQVFLTYPFVDAVVGKNPAQAPAHGRLHEPGHQDRHRPREPVGARPAAAAEPDRAVQGHAGQADLRPAVELAAQGAVPGVAEEPAVRPARPAQRGRGRRPAAVAVAVGLDRLRAAAALPPSRTR
jgi:phospholipid/cholesterol/gamma-HCH transport system substrate-binding protein